MSAAQALGALIALVIALAPAVWVRKDAIKRGMSPRWGMGVFWFMILFLPLYFVLRKPVRCSVCGAKIEDSCPVCADCEQAAEKASAAPEARHGRIFG
jgi:hypothetical protein